MLVKVAFRNRFLECRWGSRGVSLHLITAQRTNEFHLVSVFNAFGNYAHVEVMGEGNERINHTLAFQLPVEDIYERAINLDRVKRKPLEVVQ